MKYRVTEIEDNPRIGLKLRTRKQDCVACGDRTYIRRYGKPLCWKCWPVNELITGHRQQGKKGGAMETNALKALSEGEMEARVALAKFPKDLTPQEKKALAVVACSYGFDPLMGELMVYEGKVYVTIDGRYRAANETGELDGMEPTRPATPKERETWEIPAGDYFCLAQIYRKGRAHPFYGWGRVRHKETEAPKSGLAGYRPIETNPQRMAEKRAEAQALRKAFFIPLPSWEEREEGNVVEAQVVSPAPILKGNSPASAPPPSTLPETSVTPSPLILTPEEFYQAMKAEGISPAKVCELLTAHERDASGDRGVVYKTLGEWLAPGGTTRTLAKARDIIFRGLRIAPPEEPKLL